MLTKIALIAHDKKKSEIIELAKKYKDVLANYELYATGTTGTLIMGETSLPIKRMKSGPLGGDQQIGAILATVADKLRFTAFAAGKLNFETPKVYLTPIYRRALYNSFLRHLFVLLSVIWRPNYVRIFTASQKQKGHPQG